MKKIIFVTTNKHKFKEVKAILAEYNIEAEQLVMEYEEDKEADMEEISRKAAKLLADKLDKELIVEDTGLFFKTYNNFPGALPKYIFNGIGFEGIFRLLKGQDRSAYFKSVIGYCKPGGEAVVFDGVMNGKINAKVIKPKADAMPYDHIFIPEGYNKAIVEMDMALKNSFSQRGQAARKLGDYLVGS